VPQYGSNVLTLAVRSHCHFLVIWGHFAPSGDGPR
jgi:hypothetical protein